jgi:hypothetical protein
MQAITTASKDTMEIFGILNHIPEWKAALHDISRIWQSAREIYLEEPHGCFWFGGSAQNQVFTWGDYLHLVFLLDVS